MFLGLCMLRSPPITGGRLAGCKNAVCGVFVLQLIRIAREERILRQDKHYREFADTVRCKLLPGVY